MHMRRLTAFTRRDILYKIIKRKSLSVGKLLSFRSKPVRSCPVLGRRQDTMFLVRMAPTKIAYSVADWYRVTPSRMTRLTASPRQDMLYKIIK